MCNKMLSEFEKKVADYVRANGLFGSGRKLLLAVSGGADSTALLHVVHTLKAAGALNAEFVCAHVNHQLRGSDADRDEDFVTAQAEELKVPVITRRLDVRRCARQNKLSIETAARQLRIRALSDTARDNDCDTIVTAHQKNDNAETILQRLARGTGFRGLAGIWPARVFADGITFLRPLLCVGRGEILEYLRGRNLHWRDDRTNADCAHRRNYIRHRLLPELQQDCAHSIVERLSELAGSTRGFYSLISARADELWPEIAGDVGKEITLDVGTLLSQATPVKIELVRRCLEQIGCGERYLTQRHYENILQLAEQNVTGRKIQLPGDFVVLRDYGKLMLGPARKRSVGQACVEGVPPSNRGQDARDTVVGRGPPYVDKPITLNVPGRTGFGDCAIEATARGIPRRRTGKPPVAPRQACPLAHLRECRSRNAS
ncbi:MAG: tRNA lysidine(34) synthetase TilS [Planctomycetota bacterium]